MKWKRIHLVRDTYAHQYTFRLIDTDFHLYVSNRRKGHSVQLYLSDNEYSLFTEEVDTDDLSEAKEFAVKCLREYLYSTMDSITNLMNTLPPPATEKSPTSGGIVEG